MRTFISGDDRSRRFWNIELKGKRHIVNYGPVFKKGRAQVKAFPSAAEAQAAHDRLVRQRLAAGYVETTPPPVTALQQSLEDALVANPDDLAAHMAYADYLMEQEDPRGEFIQVQLALEGLTSQSKKRTALEQRFWALLGANQRRWLGELGPYLLDRPQKGTPYEFRHGWLHRLNLGGLDRGLAVVVASLPQLRLLQTLRLEDGVYEVERPLGALFGLTQFPNVRKLELVSMPLATGEIWDVVTARGLPRLTHLVVTDSALGFEDIEAIVHSGILRRLKGLELERCQMDDWDVEPLLRDDLKHLERLNLNGNRLWDTVDRLRSSGVAIEAEDPEEFDPDFCDDWAWERPG